MDNLPDVADFVIAHPHDMDVGDSSDSESDSNGSGSDGREERSKRKQKEKEAEKLHRERLGKRLSYLLRYGAEKEGLTVLEGGGFEKFPFDRLP